MRIVEEFKLSFTLSEFINSEKFEKEWKKSLKNQSYYNLLSALSEDERPVFMDTLLRHLSAFSLRPHLSLATTQLLIIFCLEWRIISHLTPKEAQYALNLLKSNPHFSLLDSSNSLHSGESGKSEQPGEIL